MNTNNLEELESAIYQWGIDRKIIQNGKIEAQMLKLIEEMGELSHAIVRNKEEEIEDAVGDIIVVLIMLQGIRGKHIFDSMLGAYNEIKDRKGYLDERGMYIKDE